MMRYRPEIDGLRTLAVVPVILFHAGLGLFAGGYVGVDVFFVISGYLITGIILADLEAGRFSLLDFYERRARRILPALVFVMAVTSVFAWLWMLPSELKDYFQSVAAAALSVSNVLFWIESGYFDTHSELKPLLHTWSLGVEEQFYVLYPLVLALLYRRVPGAVLAWLGALLAASLVLSQWHLGRDPSGTFYLLPFRAWELLAGAMCARLVRTVTIAPSDPLALLGLAGIVAPIFVFDAQTDFPGLAALPPVLGACLVILFAAPGTWAGRALSVRPMVGLGLISYSLYLWHQPVFAMARIYTPDVPSRTTMLWLAVLVVPLAWATWRFVERPFRRRGRGALVPTRGWALGSAAAALVLVSAIGAYGSYRDGFPGRASETQMALDRAASWSHGCLHTRLDPLEDLPEAECVSNAGGTKKIALVGDSIMASLSGSMVAELAAAGYETHEFTHSHCVPTRDIFFDDMDAAPCPSFVAAVSDFIRTADFDLVIVGGNFLNSLSGDMARLKRVDGAPVSRADLVADFKRTLVAFDTPVIVVMPHPRARFHVKQRALRQLQTHGTIDDVAIPEADFLREAAAPFAILSEGVPPRARLVYTHGLFCADGACTLIENGMPLLADFVHFSPAGAARVAASVMPVAQDVLNGE